MRRHFRPSQVYQATSALIDAGRVPKPQWFDALANLPPAQVLVRTQPLPHQHRRKIKGGKKPSKMFQPQPITYEEDILRKEFYKDHPWELARPRILLENDGMDVHRADWSEIEQSDRSLNGESVVQHQQWLLRNDKSLTRAEAYDKARKRFYTLRLQEDVERRIAKEEAMATGAYFGKSALDVGMELEDKEYNRWRVWAAQQLEETRQTQEANQAGVEFDEVTAESSEDAVEEPLSESGEAETTPDSGTT